MRPAVLRACVQLCSVACCDHAFAMVWHKVFLDFEAKKWLTAFMQRATIHARIVEMRKYRSIFIATLLTFTDGVNRADWRNIRH
jgi:hypothetical protein